MRNLPLILSILPIALGVAYRHGHGSWSSNTDTTTTTDDSGQYPTTTTNTTGPSPSSGGDGGGGGGGGDGTTVTGGKATFYNQEGGTGACGNKFTDEDFICAVDAARYSASLCGKQIIVTNTDNEKQVTVTVQDMCPGCPNAASLDLSVAAFNQIGDPDTGVLNIKYEISG
ncbi:barwin-like endoglucanase [Rickenella mellea]|uniref:Barwin-like endoglucanase n=1 Tax=Rickenella mellea TaxID=50990 RepID=A0A4Y7PII3_9AGAM|nr:barwin-like endoglucanase [Rickenella mellea]